MLNIETCFGGSTSSFKTGQKLQYFYSKSRSRMIRVCNSWNKGPLWYR